MWKSQFMLDGSSGRPRLEGRFGVDPPGLSSVPLKAVFRSQLWTEWVISHDADVQTPEPEKKEQTWVPGPHAIQRGPEGPQPAPSAWPAAFGGDRRLEIVPEGKAHPGAGAPGGFGLPPSSRVTRTREIRELLRRGRKKKTSHLDVFFLSSGGGRPRVGIVVPKHRRRVVDRNRVKRRLREVTRRDVLPRLKEARVRLDLLVRARKQAYDASYRQLRRELLDVTEELCSGRYSWR
jgi:ribonuclease P protein component